MRIEFDYATLGERIRNARKQKSLTQEQLAEICELSTAHIGHIERGTRALSIESLITISQALDVSTDFLLFDVSTSADKKFSNIFNAVHNAKDESLNKLYSIIKILAENIDQL